MSTETRLQFRFKPTHSFEDIDPSRIEPAVAGLTFVVRHRIYDDRQSDADFVTLVVALYAPTSEQLSALRDALVEVPGAQAFAVDRSGATYPLSTLRPERLLEVATTDALAGK